MAKFGQARAESPDIRLEAGSIADLDKLKAHSGSKNMGSFHP